MKNFRIKLVQTSLGLSDRIRYRKRSYDFPSLNVVRNLFYCEEEPENPTYSLDLYLPEESKELLPVLIDIHGGGFVYGNKELNQWTSSEMASRGYIVVALNYPLIPHATIPEQLKALHQAFTYIATLADNYPMDLNRVFLKGDSAGGFLAMLSASISRSGDNNSLNDHEQMPLDFKGLALIHPMIDIKRKGLLGYTDHFYYSRKSRLRYTTQHLNQLPPTWIVSSRNDVMFNKEARKFVRWMQRLGKPVQYHEFDYSLQRPLIHIFMVTMNTLPESQMLYDSLDHFLRLL